MNDKKLKTIGKILLVEFSLCAIWGIFNAIMGIEDGGTWISLSFTGFGAFIVTMIVGTVIIFVSNVAILVVYEMVSLIHRLYKEKKKALALLVTIILIILVVWFINWILWI